MVVAQVLDIDDAFDTAQVNILSISGSIEIADLVISKVAGEHEDIQTATAGQNIVAALTVQDVGITATEQPVTGAAAQQFVIAVAAEQLVPTGAAQKFVVASVSVQRVAARTALPGCPLYPSDAADE